MLLLNVDYKKNLINNYTYSEFNVNNKDMHSEICSRWLKMYIKIIKMLYFYTVIQLST